MASVAGHKDMVVVQLVTTDGQLCAFYNRDTGNFSIVMRPPCLNDLADIEYTLFYAPRKWTLQHLGLMTSERETHSADAFPICPVVNTSVCMSCQSGSSNNICTENSFITAEKIATSKNKGSTTSQIIDEQLWRPIIAMSQEEKSSLHHSHIPRGHVVLSSEACTSSHRATMGYDTTTGLLCLVGKPTEKYVFMWRLVDVSAFLCTPGLTNPQCIVANKICVPFHETPNLGRCVCRRENGTNADGTCGTVEGLIRGDGTDTSNSRLDFELAAQNDANQIGRMVRITDQGRQDRKTALLVAIISFGLVVGLLWIVLSFIPPDHEESDNDPHKAIHVSNEDDKHFI